ncbi:tRNA preQ1(34) S-adenosylmethionine ribosyltransferase-isomerase QueA [Camelimonas abortus]|uniref:S-adenosylmethionine:tRNA ribosyltransferase-isomerase n=1 Tax=Camelimonas abortus TaxID=1017184 RepID=A0ABV7LDZ8_9HYPH
MKVDLFDFELPESAIAVRPAQPRDSARLLQVRPGHAGAPPQFSDWRVRDLPQLLRPGDLLVLNDTRVIPARLAGTRLRGDAAARVEVTLHMREAPDVWRAFARPARRLVAGDALRFSPYQSASPACAAGELEARVEEKGEGGEVLLRFSLAGACLDEALQLVGMTPLPPYIASKRPEDARDREDYQTVYARRDGAVAAPTAGLHMTPELFGQLEAAGIGRTFVTLHVGAGTFLPVKAEDTDDHRMHAETGEISEEAAQRICETRARGGRIVAVGTTSLRLLESAAGQSPDGEVRAWSGATDIFITPGYRFRAVDVLMTNFHLPRSTLFMLVCAFSGLETMQAAYAHAIGAGYRFYSYGDASLLFRADGA